MFFKKTPFNLKLMVLVIGLCAITAFCISFDFNKDKELLVLNNLNNAQKKELENTSFNKNLEMFQTKGSENELKLTTYEKKNKISSESNFTFPNNYTEGYKFIRGDTEVSIIPQDKEGLSYQRSITNEVIYSGLNKKLTGQILLYEGNEEQHFFSLSRQNNILRQWSFYQKPAEELNVMWEFEGAVLKKTENNTFEVYKVPVDKDSQDVMAGLEPNMAQRITNTLKAELGDSYYYNKSNFLFNIPEIYFVTAQGETKQAQVTVEEGNKLAIFLGTEKADYPILLDPSISLASTMDDYVQINGDSAGDELGRSVSSAGDVNGDGYDDVIVGASLDDDNGASSGSAFIFYGGVTSGNATAKADVKLIGDASGDFFGNSVSTAGDVNGDGLDDVIVGAWGDDDGGSNSGSAFIFYSPITSGSATAQADVKLTGEAFNDYFSASVSDAGDVNGDGKDDVIVGAYEYDGGAAGGGAAFIFYGGATLSSGTATAQADVKLTGSIGDALGSSVSGGGNMNGDGLDDVIVCARTDQEGGSNSGSVFIFYGGVTSGNADTKADVKIIGDNFSDFFGSSLSGAGDVNGDGLDDVVAGALGDDDNGDGSGSVFIFYSPVTSGSATAQADVKLIGDSSGDRFGNSVSTAGDVNGDGLDDVIAGADYDDDGGSNSGSAFIFYGGVTSGVATAKADVKLIGDGVSEYFGRSVSSAGDVNGDGKDDVIVGAEDDNDNGADSGSAKIFTFEEKNFQNSVKLSGDTSVDYFGASVSSAGDVNGDGKEDVIVGAYGGDDGGPDSGSAYIFYGGIDSGNATVQADVKLIGDDTSDQFGWSVSGAGDVNGDGLDDVIVGAPSDDDGGSGSGSVFIFCGGVTSGNATSKADIKLIGDSTGDEFGASVSSAGDVNGDGKDDVIVGAYRDDDGGDDSGSAFIFYGGQVVSGGATAEAVTNGHGVKITGDDGNDNFGNPVSSAGDMNGDGKDDVIVGAYLDDDNGNTSGSAFIFYGGQVASGSATEEAVTNGHGIKLIGDNISDNFGRSISGAGDMNGDGKDDVIVGAPADDDNGNSSGSAFIFYGGVTSGSATAKADIKLTGDDASDYFGWSVSSAGDVNGDGKDDVIVGALFDDDGGNDSGSAFIFYGGVTSGSATAKADIKLTGDDAGDQFGRFVSGAGDMNGDGCDDVIVGARHDDDNGTDSGSAFIFSLGPSTEMIQIDHGSPVDSIDYFGASVSSAGDVNGDGLDDVIVGAFDDNTFETGAAYIFYGGVTSGTATAKADVKLIGDSSGDRFGHSVSGAGDVNGDGLDDVIVGAVWDDDNGYRTGSAFIFYGGVTSGIATAKADVKLLGDDSDDIFGTSVSGAGDVNGDGLDDVIVSTYRDNDNGSASGSVFIFYGGVTLISGIATAQADVKLIGDAASDYFGISVSTAGDVNGDGYDDIIVGADRDDDNGSASGSAFIFYGGATLASGTATAQADIKLLGDGIDDYFGTDVSAAGDVNGDGKDDVIVSAPRDDDNGSASGSAFIFYGGATLASGTATAQANVKLSGDLAYDSFGRSVSGAGDVNGDGKDDVIVSASGDDDNGSGSGSAFIFYGGTGLISGDATAQADVKLSGDVASDYFGYRVSNAGDVNGDGKDDVIVASMQEIICEGKGSIRIFTDLATANNPDSPIFQINGDSADDYFGYSVSSAGDVNGDGLDDIIVGAYQDDDNGSNSGSAFIFYGGAKSGFATNQADVKITGDSVDDWFGFSVSGAGDVNGDGKDDVIVGAHNDDDNGDTSGSAFIFYGPVTSGSATAQADVKIIGDLAFDWFSWSVSSAGDVNNDGYDDVIVGARYDNYGGYNSGSAFIFYGPITSGSATTQADVKLTGDDNSDQFGWSVSGAGDVNGDGYDDVIVGVPYDDDNGADSGSAFIFYGPGVSGSATAQADVKLIGDNSLDLFAVSTSGAGDVNGDGLDDVIVGARLDDDNGANCGSAFIFYGPGVSGSATAQADIKLLGDSTGDQFGTFVSSAGDINNDGLDDIIVGATSDDDNGAGSGSAFIFYGSITSGSATVQADVKLLGDAALNIFGESVSSAGDVNGDGLDDIIVGARYDDDGGNNSGSARIIYGHRTVPEMPDTLTPVSGTYGIEGLGNVPVSCSGGTYNTHQNKYGDTVVYDIQAFYDDGGGTQEWHDLIQDDADGSYSWDVSALPDQTEVDLRSRNDISGTEGGWSRWYNIKTDLEIDNIPELNTPPSAPTITGPDPSVGNINTGYEFGFVATDTLPWNQYLVDDVDADIRSATYDVDKGKYILGGYKWNFPYGEAYVWESTDLITWDVHPVDSLGRILSIIYNPADGKYVAGGYYEEKAVVWESLDLTNWASSTVETVGVNNFIREIIYDSINNKYIAVGSEHNGIDTDVIVLESTDLQTWERHEVATTTGTQRGYSIIHTSGPDKYIIAGTDSLDGSAVVWVSANLETWNKKILPGGFSSAKSIIYDSTNTRYLVGGYIDNGVCYDAVVWETTDFISWITHSVDVRTDSDKEVTSIIYNSADGKYVAAGYETDTPGGDSNAVTWFSDDLENWDYHLVAGSYLGTNIRTMFYDVTRDEYIAVGTGGGGGYVWLSEMFDNLRYGIDWTDDATDSVEEWLPTDVPIDSYVLSSTTQSTTTRWSTIGDKTFKALAQDDGGLQSGWTSHTITIGTGNTLPTAQINAPNPATEPFSPIWLTGTFEDVDAGDSFSGFEWRDGNCSTSVPIHEASGLQPSSTTVAYSQTLSDGVHHLYFRVFDNHGATSSCAMYSITINSTTECSDGIDNDDLDTWFDDGGGDINQRDPACYDVSSSTNPIYHSEYDDESADPQCSNGIDDDLDGLKDTNDPGCHTNGDPIDTESYNRFINDEDNCGSGICEIGETYQVCPSDCPFVWIEF